MSSPFVQAPAADARVPYDAVALAQQRLRAHRREGLAALERLFREGAVPNPPPDGPYHGELIGVDIAPLVTPLVEWLTSFAMPWKGKFLIAADARGDNIFSRKWRGALRVLFPFYRGNRDYDAQTFRAFMFATSVARGKVDADRDVFRIDYDRPDNPALTIRRIVDEIVEVEPGVYLGKIHFHWWWGRWQMIGYFALRP
jgi:hypothetical protein